MLHQKLFVVLLTNTNVMFSSVREVSTLRSLCISAPKITFQAEINKNMCYPTYQGDWKEEGGGGKKNTQEQGVVKMWTRSPSSWTLSSQHKRWLASEWTKVFP